MSQKSFLELCATFKIQLHKENKMIFRLLRHPHHQSLMNLGKDIANRVATPAITC